VIDTVLTITLLIAALMSPTASVNATASVAGGAGPFPTCDPTAGACK